MGTIQLAISFSLVVKIYHITSMVMGAPKTGTDLKAAYFGNHADICLGVDDPTSFYRRGYMNLPSHHIPMKVIFSMSPPTN